MLGANDISMSISKKMAAFCQKPRENLNLCINVILSNSQPTHWSTFSSLKNGY